MWYNFIKSANITEFSPKSPYVPKILGWNERFSTKSVLNVRKETRQHSTFSDGSIYVLSIYYYVYL